MALPGFDSVAQQKLTDAKVLIVGAGGLGCPVAQYLTAAGIGQIGIADFDVVSTSNLHRQILFSSQDVGQSKAGTACKKLKLLNELTDFICFDIEIAADNVLGIINDFDLIVDCTDNIETKYLLNDACVMSGKPVVYGAIFQFDGQVSIWNSINKSGHRGPNYRDVFPDINTAAIPSCSDGGVLPTVAGVVGCIQANEVIKLITGCAETLSGKLLLFDGKTSRTKIIQLIETSTIKITSIQKREYNSIDSTSLVNLIAQNQAMLIDVREKEERLRENLGGIHAPLATIEHVALSMEKINVVYCQSGRRSEQAVAILSNKFPAAKIYSLKGGINEFLKVTQ